MIHLMTLLRAFFKVLFTTTANKNRIGFMRNISHIFLIALVSLAATTLNAQSVSNGRGDVPVTVPSNYDANTATPLLVVLHGYTSSGAGQDAYMRFSALADNYGFIMIAPDGTQESAGQKNRFWNASDACCNFMGSEVDDSAYIAGLIDKVKSQYNIDNQRVMLFGHSNGGFMSYRMAYDNSETISAIASLAGANLTPSQDPSAPVNILQIHGTSDATIAYNGADIQGNAYPGALETVATWAGHNGCAVVGEEAGTLDLDTSLPGIDTVITRYTDGCKPGGAVELWTITDGSHVPPISAHYSKLVVEWLLAHPKP